jgi:methyl-accepting chemotaxis protein
MALIAIAVVTVRAMIRFERAADEFTELAEAMKSSIGQVKDVTHEIHELVASVGEVVPRFRNVMSRFEDLGDRTARLSSDLLEQVEAPVRTAVAVARGVRRGTGMLVDRLMQRLTNNRSQSNGGTGHDRQFVSR